MVAWVVIDRQHHRQAGPFASLLSTPVILLPHLSPLLPTPYGHSYTTAAPQPLCNQSLTHSFYLDGGVPTLPVHWNEFASSETEEPFFTPHYSSVLCFHALAHSFALFCTRAKLNSFVFKRFHTLCKKHPGCGGAAYLAHSAFPHPVGALRGEGVTVYQENCSQNVAAPASGRKKEMGQAGMPVPQILDGFVLGGEPILGEQMYGHFAQVPDDAEPGEDLQRVIGDVDLPPVEALSRRGHEVMMVVVPTFAERQQCE